MILQSFSVIGKSSHCIFDEWNYTQNFCFFYLLSCFGGRCPFLVFYWTFRSVWIFREFWWVWSIVTCLIFLFWFFNFAISWSLGWSFVFVVYCCLEGDLNLFLLVCFALNDFSCFCRVGLSLVRSVVLFVGGLW